MVGALVTIGGPASAQGPGYGSGMAEDSERGHGNQLRERELQPPEKLTPAQIRQKELENRLRILKMEIEKKSRQHGPSGSAAQGDPVRPPEEETQPGSREGYRDRPPTCVNEPAGRAFLECLDRIAPKH